MGRNGLTNVSKKIIASCLSVAMILTGILVMPKEAKAATNVYFASDKEYKMSDYWNGTNNKVPVKEGYVFSGWYRDQTTPLKAADLTQADDTAVAKFVPAEVLSIKTQIGTSTVDNKTITSMRILSTVDSKNYQAVGFEYKLATQPEGTTKDPEKGEITKVYSKIKQSKYSSTMYDPSEEFVSGVSKYFIAADVSSISDASFAKIVYARPYWITMDGTKVMGLARNSRVEDKTYSYTSVGINLLSQLTEDEDKNKTLAAVAAGTIQVKYNKEYYTVQSVDKMVDNSEKGVGGKYLFEEMEYHIDEANGTITFVGNAETVGDNKTADGLFANVRFAKTLSNTNGTALTLEVTTTDFCNWAEKSVTEFVVQ